MQQPAALHAVDLYWIPLGAGTPLVQWCGRRYEALAAHRAHRGPLDLYHAALEVHLDGARHVVESAPAWDRPEPDRGVVAVGPVGLAFLGRWERFRYEVRCWPYGTLPDVSAAVDSPRRLSTDRDRAARLLAAAPSFPTRTWGRDELGTGDMWNSNSLVAWLLAVSGHDAVSILPPRRGRAPGWAAGLTAAADDRPAARQPDGTTRPATTELDQPCR